MGNAPPEGGRGRDPEHRGRDCLGQEWALHIQREGEVSRSKRTCRFAGQVPSGSAGLQKSKSPEVEGVELGWWVGLEEPEAQARKTGGSKGSAPSGGTAGASVTGKEAAPSGLRSNGGSWLRTA